MWLLDISSRREAEGRRARRSFITIFGAERAEWLRFAGQ